MTIFARLAPADQNGDRHVLEIADAPDAAALAERFHPTIASQFITAPNATQPGSSKNGAIWTHPEQVEPEPELEPSVAYRTLVTRTEYYGLFEPLEEAMIRMTAAEPVTMAAINAAEPAEKQRLLGIAGLAVMLSRTDALGPAGSIDLANHQVTQGLDLLVGLGLLTQDRRNEIAQGVAQVAT